MTLLGVGSVCRALQNSRPATSPAEGPCKDGNLPTHSGPDRERSESYEHHREGPHAEGGFHVFLVLDENDVKAMNITQKVHALKVGSMFFLSRMKVM
jgi:hypothetical protein